MSPFIDTSVYPDEEPPKELITRAQKEDYIQRIVAAFDQGITPEEATLHLFANWKDVFDHVVMHRSPGYHALRAYFGWPPMRREPSFAEPTYRILDSLEGREDGFEDHV